MLLKPSVAVLEEKSTQTDQHHVLQKSTQTQEEKSIQTQQVDDCSNQQETHGTHITSNLLDLQKSRRFCDVSFVCSNGNVEAK